MAERRMFAKTIIDSDAFLDMPLSSQALYFHLSMRADDDGFINNPKKIQRMVGCGDDDLKLLVAKRFIIPFESGIVVIKHWKIHNYIQKDRYRETVYKEEKAMLEIKGNRAYKLLDTPCIHNVSNVDAQNRIGKDSIEIEIEEDSGEEDSANPTPPPPPKKADKPVKHKRGEYGHVLLTDEQEDKLMNEYGEILTLKAITFLDEYIEMKGYKAKNHYLAIKKWVIDAVSEREQKGKPIGPSEPPRESRSFDANDINSIFERAAKRSYQQSPDLQGRVETLKERLGTK